MFYSVNIFFVFDPFRTSIGPLIGSALTETYTFEWTATVSFFRNSYHCGGRGCGCKNALSP